MPARSPRKPQAKSRVSNDATLFLESVDGRSRQARRFRDVVESITADLGGADLLSEAQRQLIRRAALLAVQCEVAEAAMARGDTVDLDAYSSWTNTQRRVLATLGLERRTRDVTPPLEQYIGGGER